MRTIAVLLALLTASAAAFPAAAAPPVAKVTVAIGPELTKKAKQLGVAEVDRLASALQSQVEQALAAAGSLRADGGRLELILVDAKPARPTMEQLRATPGLSYSSISLGGASIAGDYVSPSGQRSPVRYSWFETDLRQAPYRGAWTDAHRAFSRLADRVARDQLVER